MKLQKQLSRKVDGKEYAKYVAVIPPNVIKQVGLKEGQELEIKVDGKKMIIQAKLLSQK